jgi:uncharacterized protein DUF4124
MRTVRSMAVLIALVSPAAAHDIYKWTDASGTVHYASMPGPDAGSAKTDSGDAAGSGAADDADTSSAEISLKRNALERDLRTTEKRIREIDSKLATLARARGERAHGSAATGGVGANPALRSEEEKALAEEREQLAQHAAEVRNDAVRLRDEATARAGGTTPAWWVDVR